MNIVEFYKDGEYRYGCEQLGDMSGEYVPLSEYQALKTHMESLAKESYELKGLIQRVVEMGWSLVDELGEAGWNAQSPELIQLLQDCQEAL